MGLKSQSLGGRPAAQWRCRKDEPGPYLTRIIYGKRELHDEKGGG